MIRFYNGKIIQFRPEICMSNDEVWVDGSSIAYVGKAPAELPEFERQIDLKGDLLIPGFKDAHTHTPMVFLRSLADDKPLHAWLEEDIWPNEAKLNGEAVYYLTKLGIMEYLSSGITASFDMYYYNDFYAKANVDTGFRTVICSSMNNFDKDITNIEREFIKFNEYDDLVSYRLGLHAEYTTSLERIEYMVSLAEKYKAPCYIHISETASEVQGCIDRYGKTPPQFLDSIGFFRYGGGGFHCVYFTDEDMQLFAEKNLHAISCPASNLKLASGIAKIDRMRKAGIKISLGTDGASSNNALDMFREMYLMTALQKVIENDSAACPAPFVLESACSTGADAMGIEYCNDIAVGKKADLTVINLRKPNMQPDNNTISNLVYSGSKENVRLTMINGRVLYENGEFFIGDTPEFIYSKVNEFVKTLA